MCGHNTHEQPSPHYDPPSSNVFARCTKSLVSWWLFRLVWWLARSWAPMKDCEAYVFTPSMLAGSCSYIPIDWASSQQPSPLCLTRSGWGGFAYSLDEMSMKIRGRPSPLLDDIGGLVYRVLDTKPCFLWHIFETLSMKCATIQTNRDVDSISRDMEMLNYNKIGAFLCFLTDLDFFKSEELSSSVSPLSVTHSLRERIQALQI